ncbi:hypothetical protein C8Q74DRAFT_897790 [Fomes fomentarius]|nr:hypothetical protein C8Q74DRAFT_897790 [Fomes fomentarius]
MADYFSLPLTTAYTFDPTTGQLTSELMHLPGSSMTTVRADTHLHEALNVPTLGKDTSGLVDEVVIGRGKAVYFVQKPCSDGSQPGRTGDETREEGRELRKAKRRVREIERMALDLEAAMMQADGVPKADGDDTDSDDSDDSDMDDISMDGDCSLDGSSGSDMDTDSDMESVRIPSSASFIVSAPSSPFPFPSPSRLVYLSRASSRFSFKSSPLASPCITADDLCGAVDLAKEPITPSEEPATRSTAMASADSAQPILNPFACVSTSLFTLQPVIKDDVKLSYDDSPAMHASGVIVQIPSDTGAEDAPRVMPPVIAAALYGLRRHLTRSLSAASGKDTRDNSTVSLGRFAVNGGAAHKRPVYHRAPTAPTCNSTPPASQPTISDLNLGPRPHRIPSAITGISTPSTPGIVGKKRNRDDEDDEAEAALRCRRHRLESADESVPAAANSSNVRPKTVTLRRIASSRWERCTTRVEGSRTPGRSMGILGMRARLQRRPSALGPRRTMSGSLYGVCEV